MRSCKSEIPLTLHGGEMCPAHPFACSVVWLVELGSLGPSLCVIHRGGRTNSTSATFMISWLASGGRRIHSYSYTHPPNKTRFRPQVPRQKAAERVANAEPRSWGSAPSQMAETLHISKPYLTSTLGAC